MAKIPFDRFKQTLQRYVFEQVVPTVEGSFHQFAIGAAWGVMEEQLREKLGMVGALCEDGQVNMELLDKAVAHGFKASKGEVMISAFMHKFRFRPEDWQIFRQML